MKNLKALDVRIADAVPSPVAGEAVVVPLFEDEPRVSCAKFGDGPLRRLCERLVRDGEFKGAAETGLVLYAEERGSEKTRRLLLTGLGAHADLDAAALSRAAGTAVRQAQEAGIKHLHFVLPAQFDERRAARAVTEGAYFGLYDGDLYRRREEATDRALERFTIISSGTSDGLREAVERGRVIGESVNWVRALSDEPGRALPPREFARRAAEMAEESGLRVESLGAPEIQARGMGGLWGVGRGSDEEPALIVIRYEPEGACAQDDLWAFVGKGITFDTGGISLKPGKGMEEMKADMAGGAAVLGALRAVARLKPRRRIVGVVPTAENMPSGKAIKPGDVIRTLAGYTIEVVDTDAEGRLVLVDGIAYAKRLGAARVVDLATLTGSIIYALGDRRTGLFSNDDEWAERVRAAAERAGEPVWRMPVSDDYKKLIESPVADFKNYGGRPDATGAALLLSKFAGDTPWVHLDIAGTSWYDDPQPFAPRGSTGTGVRTLVELACGGGRIGD